MARAAALLCASLVASFAWPALADLTASGGAAKTVSTYVLSIWTDDADDEADSLTGALRARVKLTPGYSLAETSDSFETLAIALKCPPKPDAACLGRIGDHLKTDSFIWGTVQKKGTSVDVTAEVHLWTRGKPDVVAHALYAAGPKDPNGEPLHAVSTNLVSALTGSMTPKPGPAAVTPPPEPAPALAPPALATAAPVEHPQPPEHPAGNDGSVRLVFGYSALVLGAASLVASGVEAANWISDSNASAEDRKSVPASVADVCVTPVNSAATDACAKSHDASNVSTLGWVFAGVGAALVGTGVYLVIVGSQHSEPRLGEASALPPVAVVPSFGPRGGNLTVSVTF